MAVTSGFGASGARAHRYAGDAGARRDDREDRSEDRRGGHRGRLRGVDHVHLRRARDTGDAAKTSSCPKTTREAPEALGDRRAPLEPAGD